MQREAKVERREALPWCLCLSRGGDAGASNDGFFGSALSTFDTPMLAKLISGLGFEGGHARRQQNVVTPSLSTPSSTRYEEPHPRPDAPPAAPPDFPMTTPMLVAPWDKFKTQRSIQKNVAEWRAKAFADGSLVERCEDMIIFFISQRWWWIPDGRPPET